MTDTAAYISLGSGIDLGLDREDNLFLKQSFEDRTKEPTVIVLGPATPQRAQHLKDYIDRLVNMATPMPGEPT